jgi:DNA-binding response OmpR family regulator/DNA-binding SARP family transcriptional activator/pimeloyl-ACP methyl ester carboxylesterase
MLTIRLLGEVAVLRDGEPLVLPASKKTRALLAYLVATGRPQRRERLCTLLWEVPDDPRGALRWSLSKLRAVVDEPGGAMRILADREIVAFAAEGVECDLYALRDLTTGRPPALDAAPADRLRAFADSINGTFLEGLDLPAQSDFQAWCIAEREDARRHHAAVLDALFARLSPSAPEAAVPYARQLVGLDAFNEPARVALLELLVRAGRREEAEQHREAGIRLLREAGMSVSRLAGAARDLRADAGQGGAVAPEAGPSPSLASPDPSGATLESIASGAAMSATGNRTAKRIVIVDDEAELGSIVAEYLARYGFAVRKATSGGELDALLVTEPADLLILDVNMPDEDGFSIARRLRARDSTPILFLTAASDVVDRVVGLELGAEDYVTKPFDLRELRARIRIVLRRNETLPQEMNPTLRNATGVSPHTRSEVQAPQKAKSERDETTAGPNETESDPRQEIRFCLSKDNVRIAYATSGEGPPLLKPANWLTHLEHDWNSPVWRHWMRDLSRERRLVRYDERGNGLSDWQVEELSFDACKRDLEAVVEAAGLQRFPMLGVSQGCASAVAYAVEHPGRATRLILYGGYARGWAMRGNPTEIAMRSALNTLMRHGWGADNPAFRQSFTSLFVPDATPEQARWFNELQRVTASPENAVRLNEMFSSIQIEALLPQVRVPTLVLHCTGDSVVPFEEGRQLAMAIPGARFVPLEGRNHILLEDEPAWGRFLSEIRSFLAEGGL